MDTITKALEPVNTVPIEFWYACTMILASILIWVIRQYFSSLNATIKDLSGSIKELTRLVTLHDAQIKNLEDRQSKRRA